MESDFLVTVGKSLIQHGYYNNRIYLISLHPEDTDRVNERIHFLQHIYSYQKIILKIPRSLRRDFDTPDTRIEAEILGYYQGVEDALFLARFYDAKREEEDAYDKLMRNIQTCKEKNLPSVQKKEPKDIIIKMADSSEIPAICNLYQQVFETYPFPIHDPVYLKKVMNCGITFFVAKLSGNIIATGSCEIDIHASSVEMSDLAVDPRYRGYGLSKKILSFMEKEMRDRGVKTAFTICRAEPLQINRLFSGFDYQYGGTLIKNTNICGKFESMNIWYKALS
ncbi:putative beta-lysine N-acetyltransferase [Methanospirillum stamsii]|uniref:Putative beta-lysine N-acetyltransferase n=1 Tax=Methanospirillum stamsii TaxID=1277351 RepID=A0A2V2MRU1_9EURY|nr:putative beta-lysine N-acetyltransferase [Methanospirillum stamsii]PWR70842.1 putative beta-lysine N-acetyltransferase [Methanospirillum stamsii]